MRILRLRGLEASPLARQYLDSDFRKMSEADQSFAKELVTGVYRYLSLLDFFIDSCSSRPVRRIDSLPLWILRLSIYQMHFLRTPSYAAVHEGVELCRTLGQSRAVGFVNAVLREFDRKAPRPPEGNSARELGLRFGHPEWLVRRYLERDGLEVTLNRLRRQNRPPPSVIWVNRFKIELQDFVERLRENAIGCEPVPGVPDALKIESAGFHRHPLYQQGFCFFMDPGSQEIAGHLDLTDSHRIGDFCAAPGGKTFLLAWRKPESAVLVASDRSPSRLREMRRRSRHLGICQVEYLQSDWTRGAPLHACFDRILLDVPCSGLGTVRSNPDVRWMVGEEDLSSHHERQLQILKNAFQVLRQGGELLYSTCSTEPEENEDVVAQFLSENSEARLAAPLFHTESRREGDRFFAAGIARG